MLHLGVPSQDMTCILFSTSYGIHVYLYIEDMCSI